MTRRALRQMDWGLVAAVLGLIVTGLVLVHSASQVPALPGRSALFARQLTWAGFSMIVLLITAMASGVRGRFSSDWGVGITGIAGPTGGTDEKPVGLVHWAVAGPNGVWTKSRVFLGDRTIVREWSHNAALDLLRRRLMTEE